MPMFVVSPDVLKVEYNHSGYEGGGKCDLSYLGDALPGQRPEPNIV